MPPDYDKTLNQILSELKNIEETLEKFWLSYKAKTPLKQWTMP
jgi:hypothetical protein